MVTKAHLEAKLAEFTRQRDLLPSVKLQRPRQKPPKNEQNLPLHHPPQQPAQRGGGLHCVGDE
jgi:hypothetical protein